MSESFANPATVSNIVFGNSTIHDSVGSGTGAHGITGRSQEAYVPNVDEQHLSGGQTKKMNEENENDDSFRADSPYGFTLIVPVNSANQRQTGINSNLHRHEGTRIRIKDNKHHNR